MECNPVERCDRDHEQDVSASKETTAGTFESNVSTVARIDKSGHDQLPKELHETKIRDDKPKSIEKVFLPFIFLTFILPFF